MGFWFWFWVVVCTVLALLLLGVAVRMFADFWGDGPVMACFIGAVMLILAGLLAYAPWMFKHDEDWRHRCADAGGVVVATDTYWTYIYSGKVLVPVEEHHYACIKGAETIDV